MGSAATNAQREADEAAKETARAEVFRLTGRIFQAEHDLAAARNTFNTQAADATKQLHGTIETPYTKGDKEQASKLHIQAVKDLEECGRIARERKAKIDPIAEDLKTLTKQRLTAYSEIDQTVLDFDGKADPAD